MSVEVGRVSAPCTPWQVGHMVYGLAAGKPDDMSAIFLASRFRMWVSLLGIRNERSGEPSGEPAGLKLAACYTVITKPLTFSSLPVPYAKALAVPEGCKS